MRPRTPSRSYVRGRRSMKFLSTVSSRLISIRRGCLSLRGGHERIRACRRNVRNPRSLTFSSSYRPCNIHMLQSSQPRGGFEIPRSACERARAVEHDAQMRTWSYRMMLYLNERHCEGGEYPYQTQNVQCSVRLISLIRK
jgi:hypothetical protein